MPRKKARKPRKPVKYKTLAFQVTARQKKSLVNYARLHHTTPNKLIKNAIRPMLEKYADLNVPVTKTEKHEQLQLF
ncbi:MAG TPA: hypothetical protein PKG48_11780 [Bacteroidales bacterium]|nr:hypothetical protein [Bacteroidales bacterium]HPS61931.1 hypothetical protein [Bacteroidales bacterium]